MRGLRSRWSALALALSLGAAGAHSLGTPSPAGAASCSIDLAGAGVGAQSQGGPAFVEPTASSTGWTRSQSERSDSGLERERACRPRLALEQRLASASSAKASDLALPARASGGLLGLISSPANAPPRS